MDLRCGRPWRRGWYRQGGTTASSTTANTRREAEAPPLPRAWRGRLVKCGRGARGSRRRLDSSSPNGLRAAGVERHHTVQRRRPGRAARTGRRHPARKRPSRCISSASRWDRVGLDLAPWPQGQKEGPWVGPFQQKVLASLTLWVIKADPNNDLLFRPWERAFATSSIPCSISWCTYTIHKL
jgi:hypothetical protein